MLVCPVQQQQLSFVQYSTQIIYQYFKQLWFCCFAGRSNISFSTQIKISSHDITEILLKVALNTIIPKTPGKFYLNFILDFQRCAWALLNLNISKQCFADHCLSFILFCGHYIVCPFLLTDPLVSSNLFISLNLHLEFILVSIGFLFSL